MHATQTNTEQSGGTSNQVAGRIKGSYNSIGTSNATNTNTITVHVDNAPLDRALRIIEKQQREIKRLQARIQKLSTT